MVASSVRSRSGGRKSFTIYFEADPISLIYAIKSGIPAAFVDELAADMGTSKDWLLATLGFSKTACNRKKWKSKPLSKGEGERVLGMARLIGQVEVMVTQSGDPKGFSAPHWVARWLQEPFAALAATEPPI